MARARSPSRPSMAPRVPPGSAPGEHAPIAGWPPWPSGRSGRCQPPVKSADVVTSLLPWASVGGVTAVPAVSIVTGGAHVATPRGIPCRGGRGSERGGAPAGQGHDVRAGHRAGRRLPLVDARPRARARSRRARPQHRRRTRRDRGPGEPGGGRRPRGAAAREPSTTRRPATSRASSCSPAFRGTESPDSRSAEPPRLAGVSDVPEVPAELARLRSSIDNIDAALVHLLAERFKCTQQVGRLKAEQRLPAADPRARGAADRAAAGARRRAPASTRCSPRRS